MFLLFLKGIFIVYDHVCFWYNTTSCDTIRQVQNLHVAAAAMRDANQELLDGTAQWNLAQLIAGLEAVTALTAEWGPFCDPTVRKVTTVRSFSHKISCL